MTTPLKIFFITVPLVLFLGCTKKYTQEVNQAPKDKIKNKSHKLKNTKESTNKYKYCKKHIQIMDHASQFVSKEFHEAYFKSNDTLGAKAQLFLIQSNSPTLFAKNINTAIDSYKTQYELAKKHKCNIANFDTSVLQKIKNEIEKIENKQKAVKK